MTPVEVTEFLTAQNAIDKARMRVAAVTKARDVIVVRVAACSLCKAPAGRDCFKPSGGQRGPHVERLRMAILRVISTPDGHKRWLTRTEPPP